MKKFLAIVVLGLLWCSNAYAGEVKELKGDITVNSLLQDGWKLFSSNGTATSDAEGYVRVGVFYTLTKGREVITCSAAHGVVSCYLRSRKRIKCRTQPIKNG